jgi:hypothetical protein
MTATAAAVVCACCCLAVSSDDDEGEELPFHKSMMEESRRVEEYERLNRISGGAARWRA